MSSSSLDKTIIKTFETLYNTTIGTGRKKQWSILVLDNGNNTYTIRSSHGIVGGKQVDHETIISEGKNIGKKNETTPKQQALLEAEREWTKKTKQGYNQEYTQASNEITLSITEKKEECSNSVVEVEVLSKPPKKKLIKRDFFTSSSEKSVKVIEKQNPVVSIETTETPEKEIKKRLLKPMLALELDLDKPIKFPVYIQPKLDGVRCLVYKQGSNIIFQSRQNTIYEPFEHLIPELEILFSKLDSTKDFIFDGELYTHGMNFESITGIVRRSKNKHSDTHKIKYHIYDCFYFGEENLSKNNIPYSERYNILKKVFNGTLFSTLILVETHQANTMKDIEDFHTHYTNLEHPYEGVMIRTMNGVYKQQGRSKDLQKYKKFSDEEFEIIGHHEGTGSHSGTPIFECKSKENPDKTFSVTLQGSIESRKEIMKDVKSYYGKLLIVKYQEKSKDGIPRFPVGLGFRDYE